VEDIQPFNVIHIPMAVKCFYVICHNRAFSAKNEYFFKLKMVIAAEKFNEIPTQFPEWSMVQDIQS
jgi:hypothetical protein